MITRRCTQRQFLMRPDKKTNNAFLYCLIICAQKHNIGVLFTIANSNHHHTGIIDHDGNFPEFIREFHRLFANHQNAYRNRTENFWDCRATSAIHLVTYEDAFDKMVYALTNPVKDGLVARAKHWPGATSLTQCLEDTELIASKPNLYFLKKSDLPEKVSLKLSPILQDGERLPESSTATGGQDQGFYERLRDAIETVEKNMKMQRQETGTKVMGRLRVLRQNWNDCPQNRKTETGIAPRIACKNKRLRIAVLKAQKAFQKAYRMCFDLFKLGIMEEFPAGTYWLHRNAPIRICTSTDLSYE